jgi:hypothetical protein
MTLTDFEVSAAVARPPRSQSDSIRVENAAKA